MRRFRHSCRPQLEIQSRSNVRSSHWPDGLLSLTLTTITDMLIEKTLARALPTPLQAVVVERLFLAVIAARSDRLKPS